MRFEKPSLSFEQQLELLESRGMHIEDHDKALRHLRFISYYRLRAYWYPFEVPPEHLGDHAFRADTSFDDILDLYVFDRKLRLLILNGLERIEVALLGA